MRSQRTKRLLSVDSHVSLNSRSALPIGVLSAALAAVTSLLTSCGGTAANPTTASSVSISISITITPAAVGLRPGATQTFSATVTGSSGTAVMWSVQEPAGGTITDAGVYTAPPTFGTYHVIVTSVADFAKTATATVFVVEAGSFRPTGSMSTRRDYFTATLLSDGKVLVAGGDTLGRPDGLPTSSAELFDPAAETFSSVASMTTPREAHTATLLADEKNVLLIGGRVQQFPWDIYTATGELYNSSLRSFSPTGSMSVPRFEHTATLLESGKVLIVGGSNDVSARVSAEVYDPTSHTFTPANRILMPRAGHTATRLPNGKVFITGGETEPGHPTSSAELYDPKDGSFTLTGSMGSARVWHAATLLPNGKVLITGGGGAPDSAEIYDPVSGLFSTTGPMALARAGHTATLLLNEKVLVAGGASFSFPPPGTAELYDPKTGSFTITGNMTIPRYGATATLLLPSGKVLIAGGSLLASAEIYEH